MNQTDAAIDRIIEVMTEAFDPAYGEAWNRRQVNDALMLGDCRYLLIDSDQEPSDGTGEIAGFILSRQALDEVELLLIAIRPTLRRRGIGSALVQQFIADAKGRSVTRVFLEMRDGNPAEVLYRKYGFEPVGRRKNYYNRGTISGIDAISFALRL